MSMKEIFNNPTLELAHEAIKRIAKRFEKSAPEFVEWLEANVEEGLSCYHFPRSHQRKIRTTNGLERINREIKRRTRVAMLFPNTESALRLVTEVVIEIHEEWLSGKQYLNMKEETFYDEDIGKRLVS